MKPDKYQRFGPDDGPCLAVCANCTLRKRNWNKTIKHLFGEGPDGPFLAILANSVSMVKSTEHECSMPHVGIPRGHGRILKDDEAWSLRRAHCAGHILAEYKETGIWPKDMPAVMVTDPGEIQIPKENPK